MNTPFAYTLKSALTLAVVSRQVSEDGLAVGFLYREAPGFPNDSGWRFFSGAEDDAYTDNPDHFQILPLNEVLEGNPEIAPLMSETQGAWEWDDAEQAFTAAEDWQPQE